MNVCVSYMTPILRIRSACLHNGTAMDQWQEHNSKHTPEDSVGELARVAILRGLVETVQVQLPDK
jgi:hypothetical protein